MEFWNVRLVDNGFAQGGEGDQTVRMLGGLNEFGLRWRLDRGTEKMRL